MHGEAALSAVRDPCCRECRNHANARAAYSVILAAAVAIVRRQCLRRRRARRACASEAAVWSTSAETPAFPPREQQCRSRLGTCHCRTFAAMIAATAVRGGVRPAHRPPRGRLPAGVPAPSPDRRGDARHPRRTSGRTRRSPSTSCRRTSARPKRGSLATALPQVASPTVSASRIRTGTAGRSSRRRR
jgi:hypothetical protein